MLEKKDRLYLERLEAGGQSELASVRALIDTAKYIPVEDLQLINSFIEHVLTTESKRRAAKLGGQMRRLWERKCITKPFKDYKSREDFEGLVKNVKQMEDISEVTKQDYLRVVRQFFKWLNDDEVPRALKQILKKGIGKAEPEVDPEKAITEDEVLACVRALGTPKKKLLYWHNYYTGSRAEEVCVIKVGDINLHPENMPAEFYSVRVPGCKTFSRTLTFTEGKQLYEQYLLTHPCKDKPNFKDAPLFVNEKSEPLSQVYLNKVIRLVHKQTGIYNKRYNTSKGLRKSRAMERAQVNADPYYLMNFFGWKSIATSLYYIKAGKKLMEEQALKEAGVKIQNSQKIKLKCLVCGYTNSPAEAYCSKCKASLKEAEGQNTLDTLRKKIENLEGLLAQIGIGMGVNAPADTILPHAPIGIKPKGFKSLSENKKKNFKTCLK